MIRMNYATIVGTVTPLSQLNTAGVSPFSWRADTTVNEGMILSESNLKRPRARRWETHDGMNSRTITNYSRSGTRDLILMDGTPQAEAFQNFAYINPTVHFDFEFLYYLNDSDDASGRIQMHRNCFILNQPVVEVNNEVVNLKITLDYLSLEIIDAATGKLVDGSSKVAITGQEPAA